MPLPYPTKVILPFDIATAQDMNERHANDVALANGTGLNNGAVTANKIDFATLLFGNYSTSEVDTGFKYIDGKSIYKRSFTGTISSAANVRSAINLASGVSTLIDSSGRVRQSPAGEEVNIGSYWTGTTGAQYASVWTARTAAGQSVLYSVFSDARTNAPYTVTILYTKS